MDFSETRGRSYRCVDGCALCCLCQPELLPEEEKEFSSSPELSPAVTKEHISPDVVGSAIRLKGRYGSCYFLKDKRCLIYGRRPHYCRSFPINVFVGWRIQLNVNLSCRGIGQQGVNLDILAREILDRHGKAKLEQELHSASKVFSEFVSNCRSAKVSQSFDSVRDSGRMLSEEMTRSIELSRVMTYAEHARTKQNTDAREIVKTIRKTEPEANIEERALIDGTELFDLADMSLLPVYVDRELRWRLFKLQDKEIIGFLLQEDGDLREVSRTDPSEIILLPLEEDGRKQITDYVKVMNSRDCFLGHAAHLCDAEGYEYNFAQVYLGAMANNVVDLWWRSSLLAHIDGKSRLGDSEVRDGIVFFDMDLLDLPTIGAFI